MAHFRHHGQLPHNLFMTIKLPFLFASRILPFPYIGLIAYKRMVSEDISFGWTFAMLTVIMLCMAISHFRENKLPYFYPMLFMYGVVAVAIYFHWL